MENVGAEEENEGSEYCEGWHSCHLVAEQTRYPEEKSLFVSI